MVVFDLQLDVRKKHKFILGSLLHFLDGFNQDFRPFVTFGEPGGVIEKEQSLPRVVGPYTLSNLCQRLKSSLSLN
jgi:hypothetical protein